MEFSELFELNRIASKSKFSKSTILPTLPRNPKELNTSASPPLPTLLLKPILQDDLIFSAENQPEKKNFEALKFEKDNSYLHTKHFARKSSLTESLLSPFDSNADVPNSHLVILIYFFRSLDKLKLILPVNITVSGLLSKALLAYNKTFMKPLPFGLDSNGYEVWVTEDDNQMPDMDYVLNKNSFVSTLGVNVLCVCEKQNFIDRKSYTASRNIRKLMNKDKKIVIFYFEGIWTNLEVDLNSSLLEVLEMLIKKLAVDGKPSEEMFEFKIFINGTCEECPVDMRLKIKELETNDIRLYRKKYADTPFKIKRKIRKSA